MVFSSEKSLIDFKDTFLENLGHGWIGGGLGQGPGLGQVGGNLLFLSIGHLPFFFSDSEQAARSFARIQIGLGFAGQCLPIHGFVLSQWQWLFVQRHW